MGDENRRMEDRELGKFMGRMDQFCENQETMNQKIQEVIEKLDTKFDNDQKTQNAEIENLKGSRRGLIGLLIGSSMGGSSLTAALMKYFGVTGGHIP